MLPKEEEVDLRRNWAGAIVIEYRSSSISYGICELRIKGLLRLTLAMPQHDSGQV